MMKPVRILCFNIHGGYSRDGRRDLARVRDILDFYDIDIAAFQESETRPCRGGKSTDIDLLCGEGRAHRLPGPTMKDGEGWYGNLIASRFPILRAQAYTMETTFDLEPRNAIDALIETPHGKFRLLNTHLSLSPMERGKEVPKLIELVAEVEAEERHPVLLMGDLNIWNPYSRLLSFLNAVMIPVPTGPTFPSGWPFLTLDRVWYDAPGLKVSAKVLTEKNVAILSDHLPLLIELDFTRSETVTLKES